MRRINFIDILIVILFLLAVYFIFTRIFGHSATDLSITITLFTLLGGMSYKLNREVGEFKVKTISSFDNLRKDMEKIKDELIKIKKALT